MGIILGKDGKLLHYDPPLASWDNGAAGTAYGNCRDVTLNLEKNLADITTRDGDGWRQQVGVLKDGTVTFQSIWDTADAIFIKLQEAWANDTPICFAVLDTDAIGGQGLYAEFSVSNLTRNEPLEEAMTIDVSMVPTRGDVIITPQWVTVAGP